MSAVVFSSPFTGVPANGSGQHPDNSDAFVNLKPFPVYVDELSFSWAWTPPGAGSSPIGTVLGDVVRARVNVGRLPVTNGFVPVCLLARSKNWEANVPGSTLTEPVVATPAPNFVWELPCPIYLRPGERIDVWIQSQNDFVLGTAQAAVTVRVAARGRMAPNVPARRDLPYATAFLSSIYGATAASASSILPPVAFESNFADLFNPFDVPLEVERMIYEMSQTVPAIGALSAALSPVDGSAPGPYVNGDGFAAISNPLDRRYLKMKMHDQDSNPIIRDFVPIGAVISPQDRSWPMNSVLGPKGYYKALFQLQLPSFVDQYVGDSFGARVGLSIVGHRRIG